MHEILNFVFLLFSVPSSWCLGIKRRRSLSLSTSFGFHFFLSSNISGWNVYFGVYVRYCVWALFLFLYWLHFTVHIISDFVMCVSSIECHFPKRKKCSKRTKKNSASVIQSDFPLSHTLPIKMEKLLKWNGRKEIHFWSEKKMRRIH